MGAMGALEPKILKIRPSSTRNFWTFYYCHYPPASEMENSINTQHPQYKILTRPLGQMTFLSQFAEIKCCTNQFKTNFN